MELQLQLEVRFAAARWRVGASTRRIETRAILVRRVAWETDQRVTTFSFVVWWWVVQKLIKTSQFCRSQWRG